MKLPKWVNTPIILGVVVLGLLVLALLTPLVVAILANSAPPLECPCRTTQGGSRCPYRSSRLCRSSRRLGGLYYTSRSFQLTREAQNETQKHANETSRLNAQTLALTERGQITDRYAKAVEMLGKNLRGRRLRPWSHHARQSRL